MPTLILIKLLLQIRIQMGHLNTSFNYSSNHFIRPLSTSNGSFLNMFNGQLLQINAFVSLESFAVMAQAQNGEVNPECPNGCTIYSGNGCYCYIYLPNNRAGGGGSI